MPLQQYTGAHKEPLVSLSGQFCYMIPLCIAQADGSNQKPHSPNPFAATLFFRYHQQLFESFRSDFVLVLRVSQQWWFLFIAAEFDLFLKGYLA